MGNDSRIVPSVYRPEEAQVSMYVAEQAVATMTASGDYTVRLPLGGVKKTLRRDVDFGVIPGTKSPSLYKAGAEAICLAYGLVPHISMESKTEEWHKGAGNNGEDLFFGLYTMKCELHKIGNNGVDYVIASGYGSANTFEKRNGWNKGKPDAINSSIKMAAKRAMVGTVLSISGLSSMFSQDIEDEDFMKKADDVVRLKDDDPVTTKQMRLIYSLAGEAGLTRDEVKKRIKDAGFNSTKDIKQKDFETVMALFDKKD